MAIGSGMTTDPDKSALERLGYDSLWLESGVLSVDLLRAQIRHFESADGDRNTEHYRNAALQAFLESRTQLTNSEVAWVLELGRRERDKVLRPNFAYSLVQHLGMSDDQFDRVARSHESEGFQRIVRRMRCLRALSSPGVGAGEIQEACEQGDAVVHRALLERDDLRRDHVTLLCTKGANRAIRNRAQELLASGRFRQ